MSSKPSRFGALLPKRPDSEIDERAEEYLSPIKDETANAIAARRQQQLPSAEIVRESEKKLGRPNGKRTDPDFEQVTSYLRKATHQEAQIRLMREGKKRDFSELLEELVTRWLNG